MQRPVHSNMLDHLKPWEKFTLYILGFLFLVIIITAFLSTLTRDLDPYIHAFFVSIGA